MNADWNDALPASECCGMCRRKIRMRDEVNLVLCTAQLDVVAADREACDQYEKSSEDTEKTYTRGF